MAGCGHSAVEMGKYSIFLEIFFGGKRQLKNEFNQCEDDEDIAPLIDNSLAVKKAAEGSVLYFLYFCFVMMGIALSTAWGSISFLYSYWVWRYMDFPNLWPAFILGYNLPGLPLLFLQMKTDKAVERRIGLWSSYALRIGITFALLTLIVALVPYVNLLNNALLMIVIATVVGVLVGLGSGWLYAMGAYFPPQCTGYILIGQGISTLLILADTRIFPIGNKDFSHANMLSYFGTASILTFLGIAFFIMMMLTDFAKKALPPLGAYDLDTALYPLNDDDYSQDSGAGALLKAIWPSGLACFITNFGVVGAVSLISLVAKTSSDPRFPEVILYTTSFATLAGNELAILMDKVNFITTQWGLLVFSCIRIVGFPLMILYVRFNVFRNDYVFYAFIGLYALTGAFANSKCYGLGAKYAPPGQSANAAYWMNIILYSGVYVGATVPYWIVYLVE